MNWQEWTIDNLPEPKRKVLLWYKGGSHGAIDFFFNEEAKENYIKGMKWQLDNIHEFPRTDPITHWMYFPDPPLEKELESRDES
jgi:Protein of unknown function (DUF551)